VKPKNIEVRVGIKIDGNERIPDPEIIKKDAVM
jgi:hypothetical protein